MVADPPTDPRAFAELVMTLEGGGVDDVDIVPVLEQVLKTFEGAAHSATRRGDELEGMPIRRTRFTQPNGRSHWQLHVSDEPDWSLFDRIARALETGLSGTWTERLDGLDERYWDLVVGEGKLTLHLQHYLGISVYPTAGADADEQSLAALERAYTLLSETEFTEIEES